MVSRLLKKGSGVGDHEEQICNSVVAVHPAPLLSNKDDTSENGDRAKDLLRGIQ